jgi:hypothetical protein
MEGAACISGVTLGITEDQQLGRRHFQSHFFSLAAVVDPREQGDPLALKKGRESFAGLRNQSAGFACS